MGFNVTMKYDGILGMENNDNGLLKSMRDTFD